GGRGRRLAPGTDSTHHGGLSMTPYTTRTRARIQPRDLAHAVGTDAFRAATSLAVLERIRTAQAEAEVARRLQAHGVGPASAASRLARLRQAFGASLIHLGARLAATSVSDASPASAARTT